MASELTVGKIGVGIAPAHAATIYGTGAGNATVQIEGEGGADPTLNFLVNNATHWAIGADDSDSDSLKICQHSAVGSTNNFLTISSTGLTTFANGIAFSSQTDTSATGAAATSTTLDHYEEGTFTLVEPTVGTAITGGVGKYTRIGDRVFITVQFTLGTVTNGSHFKVAGLPFPVPDDDDSKGLVLNYSNKTDVEYAVTTKNSSEVEFRTDTGGYSTCTNASGGTFNLQGHYKV